ncbi:carbon-nitrogen hydrolase family protein [Thalassoglobus sp. JC818]|uniref:carbon-nitrogen hydrolase family protein n=1 Tax=Thalassoglobus sp. JC818 TaxID=3232136 RepID=UPI0034596D2C
MIEQGSMPQEEFCIAVAQSASVKGDIAENIRRHAEIVSCAADHGAKLVLFPELSLTGYEPTIAAETAIEANDPCLTVLQELSDSREIAIIAGAPIRSSAAKPFIGALTFRPRLPIEVYRKRFVHPDEFPWFIPSDDVAVYPCHGREVGVAICADISNPIHPADTFQKGATIYVASVAKTPEGVCKAEDTLARYAREYKSPVAMANYACETGGFPTGGRSAVWDECGKVIVQAPESGEYLMIAKNSESGWEGQLIAIES